MTQSDEVMGYRLLRNRVFLVCVGVLVLATIALTSYRAVRPSKFPQRNPIPSTTQSVEVGHRLYRAYCAVCHGPEGYGDGPAAASLVPRPSDLRRAADMDDSVLFARITEGLPGTAMPAFRDVLTEEERWHVVNFLRTLGSLP